MHLDLTRDRAKTMPSVPNPAALNSLCIWHCAYRTLAPIAQFVNTETHTIGTFPDTSFEVLSPLHALRYLRVIHLPKVIELTALAGLTKLESLSLETLPSWDAARKRTIVTSLEPVASLPHLKHLSLLGVVPRDRSLATLERCRKLANARFQGYPKAEVARFFATTGVSNSHNSEPVAG